MSSMRGNLCRYRMLRNCFAVTILLGLLISMTDAIAQDTKPRVSLKTNLGEIVIELEPTRAPLTVENFLTYVRDGQYDGTVFHRIIKDFMIQGGGFSSDFQRKSTRPDIRNEADRGMANNRGTIAMARTSDPHSASAQFFINTNNNDFLNHTEKSDRGWGYTAFGRVVKGMIIVNRISRVPTGAAGPFPQDAPQAPVIIEKATVLGR